jgi:hypothetical protein
MTKQSMVAPNTAPLLQYPPPRAATPGVAADRKKYLSQVDLAHARRSGGWVESMRASSPTHSKAAAAGVDEEHAAWMVRRCPRLYLCFFRLNLCADYMSPVCRRSTRRRWARSSRSWRRPGASRSSSSSTTTARSRPSSTTPTPRTCPTRCVLLRFPFLSPPLFRSSPANGRTVHQMRRAVRSVAKHFLTAIVTGRGRDKVTAKPSASYLIICECHGSSRGTDLDRCFGS